MITVNRWTGFEAKLLREALRLSIRDFAERLGVGVRTVNKWEARQSDITQLPYLKTKVERHDPWLSEKLVALRHGRARICS